MNTPLRDDDIRFGRTETILYGFLLGVIVVAAVLLADEYGPWLAARGW